MTDKQKIWFVAALVGICVVVWLFTGGKKIIKRTPAQQTYFEAVQKYADTYQIDRGDVLILWELKRQKKQQGVK